MLEAMTQFALSLTFPRRRVCNTELHSAVKCEFYHRNRAGARVAHRRQTSAVWPILFPIVEAPFIQGNRMKLRRQQTGKKTKTEPKDLALQFRELERLRTAVAKAEAEIAKEAARQRRSHFLQKP
jgi:hypothetical protein